MKNRFILMIISLILMLSTSVSFAGVQTFSDVYSYNWAYKEIERAHEDGVLTGTGGGKFQPNANIRENEFIAVLARTFYADQINTSDVKSGKDWDKVYINTPAGDLVKGGRENHNYKVSLSRYDMAYTLYSLLIKLGYSPLTETQIAETLNEFSDSINEEYREAVATVHFYGLMSSAGKNGEFLGDNTSTRAQLATIYSRVKAYKKIERSIEDVVKEQTENNVRTILAGDKVFYINMTRGELFNVAGKLDESIRVADAYTIYFFGTDTYKEFLAAVVEEDRGTVSAVYACGKSFDEGKNKSYNCTPNEIHQDFRDNERVYEGFIKIGDSSINTYYEEDENCVYSHERLHFHRLNAFRVMHGRSILSWNDNVYKAAKDFSYAEAKAGHFGHTGADGSRPKDRVAKAGARFSCVGENIIKTSGTICVSKLDGALESLINSEKHRENILDNSYTQVGIGMVFYDKWIAQTTEDYIY